MLTFTGKQSAGNFSIGNSCWKKAVGMELLPHDWDLKDMKMIHLGVRGHTCISHKQLGRRYTFFKLNRTSVIIISIEKRKTCNIASMRKSLQGLEQLVFM